MTIALEQLGDGSAADRNFQRLMALVMDTGGQTVGIRFGSNAVTFGGASASATQTVAHGLGIKPTCILVTTIGSTNMSFEVPGGATTTATQFQVTGTTRDGTSPANGTQRFFYWLAIG